VPNPSRQKKQNKSKERKDGRKEEEEGKTFSSLVVGWMLRQFIISLPLHSLQNKHPVACKLQLITTT
jgi:hypothetical protein